MKKIKLLIAIGLYPCFVPQPANAQTARHPVDNAVRIKQAISKVNKRYGEAFIKADSALFLDAYTPDACLLPSYTPAICGVDGQLAFYRLLYKTGIRNVVFTTRNLYGITGEYVTEEGTFETFAADDSSLGKGKYLVVWKKTTAGWKMYRDSFSSDAPPALKR